MVIEFLDGRSTNVPIEHAPYVHATLMQDYMNSERSRSKVEASNFKYLGLFAMLSLMFYLLQENGTISDFLIGVIFSGVGSLTLIAIEATFFSLRYDEILSLCLTEGKKLENTYPSQLGRFFTNIDALKPQIWKTIFMNRLLTTGAVGSLTATAGFFYALQINLTLSIFVAIFSLCGLTCGAFFLYRAAKKTYS